MHAVNLDFRAPGRHPLGALLALVGALSVLATGVAFFLLAQKQLELESRQSSLQAEARRIADAGQAAAAYDPDGEIARRLTRPWQSLLLELEAASDPRIAVLEIRPDSGQRQLKLTAEAATLDEALGYVRKLQGVAVLQRAHLVNYTAMPTAAGVSVLRFIVQAEWVAAGVAAGGGA